MFYNYDDSRGVQSALDVFFTNDSGTVLSFELVDRVMNLSDHTPIAVQCRSDNFLPVYERFSDGKSGSKVGSATQTAVNSLRWDHADLERYHAVTGLYMQSVLDDLAAIVGIGASQPTHRHWAKRWPNVIASIGGKVAV